MGPSARLQRDAPRRDRAAPRPSARRWTRRSLLGGGAAAAVIAATTGCTGGGRSSAPEPGSGDAGPVERVTVAVRSDTYEVLVGGEGPPIALYPSLGRPATDFDHLTERLRSAGYRTLALNPPGISTPLPDGPHRADGLADLADDLWAVLDELGADRPALVGHAFGNRLVRTASAARPERVAALVLLACGGEVSPSPEVWREFLDCFATGLPADEHLSAVAHSFFARPELAVRWKDGWYPDVASIQSAAVEATDPSVYAIGGTAPGLIVQGLDDVIAPPVNAWNLVERRPGTRVLGLPSCGHAILPEQPDAVADAVVSLLAEHLGS